MSRKPKTKLKLKSKRGAVKRFKAMKRHILTKKAAGRKRGLATAGLVSDADAEQVHRMLLK